MRLASLLPLLALGCYPIGYLAHPVPDSGEPEGDTDADTDTDTDTDADADADSDADTDTTPQPDFTVWDGTRTFSYDYAGGCEESVYESGQAVQEGDEGYEELRGLCPGCDWLYRVEVSPDQVCDWIDIATTTNRGLQLYDGGATVWRLDEKAQLLAEGSFDGWTVQYAYESDYWVMVDGTLTFPVAP